MWAVCLFVQTTLVSKLAESYSKSCWSRSGMWVMVVWDTPGTASQAKTKEPGAHMLPFFFEILLVKNFHCWPNNQLQPFSLKADFMPNYCTVKSFNIFRTSEFHICRLCNMAVVNFVEQSLKSIEADLKPSVPWSVPRVLESFEVWVVSSLGKVGMIFPGLELTSGFCENTFVRVNAKLTAHLEVKAWKDEWVH